jgi:hypothetical protein
MQTGIASFAHGGFAFFAGIEVVLAGSPVHQFTGFSLAKSLGGSFVSFYFRHE